MLYSYSLIPFVIFALHTLFLISNANPSVDDNLLIAFMKGQQENQISEYSMEKYEAHLGIMHFMLKNWQCDKISGKFEKHERTECQKYRKYLDILYEYLYREYAGIPTVKPKFVFKERIEIDGPIIYALNCLAKVSQFYFREFTGSVYKYKFKKLLDLTNYIDSFEPKLLNEERLNYYETKLPINEIILQLAIETANECQSNESLNGIIREKFEGYLEEMFKKAEKRAIKEINNNKHKIIVESKFDDKLTWTVDSLFSEFVKGLTTNSEKFFKMAEEYSNYLSRNKNKGFYGCYDVKPMITFGCYEIEKMKKHLTQKYAANLGVMYLMRENWQCNKIGKKIEEKCIQYKKYVDILYEYLFRLYTEGKCTELANKFPAVKPIFIQDGNKLKLIEAAERLNDISKYFWKKGKKTLRNTTISTNIILKNEVELNYKVKEKENLFNKLKQKISQKKREKILNLSAEIEEDLRQEFEQKMKQMYENTKENVATNYEERQKKYEEFCEKFGTFTSSPFS